MMTPRRAANARLRSSGYGVVPMMMVFPMHTPHGWGHCTTPTTPKRTPTHILTNTYIYKVTAQTPHTCLLCSLLYTSHNIYTHTLPPVTIAHTPHTCLLGATVDTRHHKHVWGHCSNAAAKYTGPNHPTFYAQERLQDVVNGGRVEDLFTQRISCGNTNPNVSIHK